MRLDLLVSSIDTGQKYVRADAGSSSGSCTLGRVINARPLPTTRLPTTGAAHRRAQRLMHATFERNAQPLCLPRQALDLRDAASCGAVSAAAVRSLSHALPQMTHLHLGALRSVFDRSQNGQHIGGFFRC